jgi:hypothetical protein
MGSIDTPTDAAPVAHIYAANLPAWAALDEDWPRYEKMESGRGCCTPRRLMCRIACMISSPGEA